MNRARCVPSSSNGHSVYPTTHKSFNNGFFEDTAPTPNSMMDKWRVEWVSKKSQFRERTADALHINDAIRGTGEIIAPCCATSAVLRARPIYQVQTR